MTCGVPSSWPPQDPSSCAVTPAPGTLCVAQWGGGTRDLFELDTVTPWGLAAGLAFLLSAGLRSAGEPPGIRGNHSPQRANQCIPEAAQCPAGTSPVPVSPSRPQGGAVPTATSIPGVGDRPRGGGQTPGWRTDPGVGIPSRVPGRCRPRVGSFPGDPVGFQPSR